MWEIEFSREANNYAIDSHPYNEAVLLAIEQLAFSKDGWPSEGVYRALDNWCIWEIADHIVLYEKEDRTLYIYLWMIKPKE